MKKIYVACTTLILCLLFVLAGCTPRTPKVFDYLKEGKSFGETSGNSAKYRVNLTVNEDLSYNLSVSYGEGALKSYGTEGTNMTYLGCYEKSFNSEWLGVSQNGVSYYHVVKLPEATVENNDGVYTFHLIANATSKNSDSFSLSLVYAKGWDSNFDDDTNLYRIVNSQPSFALRKK